MSVPVLPLIEGALVLPLVGAIDAQRMKLLEQTALQAVTSASARQLVLDVTGVLIIDTAVAAGLLRIIKATQLLGATVVLCGIRPEVAQALIQLDVQLGRTATFSTLQRGIEYVLGNARPVTTRS